MMKYPPHLSNPLGLLNLGHMPSLTAGHSKYKPHQGKRECDRRRIGGFHTLHRKWGPNER